LDRVEANIHHDAKQVGAEFRAKPEAADAAVQIEKDRLYRVFRIFLAAEHAPRHAEQRLLEMPVDGFISAQIALLAAADDLALVFKLANQDGLPLFEIQLSAW
jgi:hypothetical protein